MPNPPSDPHIVSAPGQTRTSGMDDLSESANVFIDGLKNAHAMENQALSIMRPQLERIENYPEIAARLEQHIRETESQIERLDAILDTHGEDKSGLKDMAMSLAGGMAALSHSMAGDEILKNSMANYAFEHYEIAAYKSLLTLARTVGANEALPLLQKTLDEEQAMAEWLDRNLESVTLQYATRRETGDTAKH